MNLQRLMSYTRRALDDFNMIEDGDRIAVGLSGGKDSLALLTALSEMRRFYPRKYELYAVTVSLGFKGMDFGAVQRYCDGLGVALSIVETNIAEVVFDTRKEENPCSLCSKMRKGALNSRAAELNCNKTALGHNKDDVIETLLMCLFFEGRINTFAPVTFLDRMGLYAIRPLIYTDERDIKSFASRENLPVLKNECPVDKSTKREEIKQFIKMQGQVYKDLPDKLFSAVKGSAIPGWRDGK
ncbi:MAG: tRNA 2-thiocytidine biosynthesis TtcA family protein [Defluviitaleaceae bacterium]|nr:tRNA 2-thiocytidine biosynthesis TtcA family protein [Defluviitaleaceae bacterium]MCL2836782.1 tRNA 2-thiocytidine biosynthesis TtcA family protein [Defluviitaleaceae bacterium]